jgi:hypothetical protein
MVVADEDRTVPLTENPVPPDPEPEEPNSEVEHRGAGRSRVRNGWRRSRRERRDRAQADTAPGELERQGSRAGRVGVKAPCTAAGLNAAVAREGINTASEIADD